MDIPQSVIKLPPKLSLLTVYQHFRAGTLDQLAEQMIAMTSGADQPITLADFIGLAHALGWLAPAGEFVPPIGTVVERYRRYIDLDPGETKSVCWSGPVAVKGSKGCKKIKRLDLFGDNLTAQDAVTFRFEFIGALQVSRYSKTIWAPDSCPEDHFGSFSIVENVTVPAGTTVRLDIINSDDSSAARVRIEGRMWDVIDILDSKKE